MTVVLLDAQGYDVARVEVPEPLPVCVIWGDQVYLRILRRSTRYRQVSSYVSSDTSIGTRIPESE